MEEERRTEIFHWKTFSISDKMTVLGVGAGRCLPLEQNCFCRRASCFSFLFDENAHQV